MSELREKVARAIFDYLGPDNGFDYPPDISATHYNDASRAVIAVIVELCANVAESLPDTYDDDDVGHAATCEAAAAAIRALAGKP